MTNKRIVDRIKERDLQIKTLQGTQVLSGAVALVSALVRKRKFNKLEERTVSEVLKKNRLSNIQELSLLGTLVSTSATNLIIHYLKEQQRKDKAFLPEHFDFDFDKNNRLIKRGHNEKKLAKQLDQLKENNSNKESLKKQEESLKDINNKNSEENNKGTKLSNFKAEVTPKDLDKAIKNAKSTVEKALDKDVEIVDDETPKTNVEGSKPKDHSKTEEIKVPNDSLEFLKQNLNDEDIPNFLKNQSKDE